MKISTQEIRNALELILKEYESSGASEWVIEDDFYWDVPTEARYQPYAKPEDLGVGQLSDDMEKLRAISAGDDSPVPLGLVWLAAVLRVAGERGPFKIRKQGEQANE